MRAQKRATANQGGTRMAEDKEDQRVSYDEAFFFSSCPCNGVTPYCNCNFRLSLWTSLRWL